MTGRRVRMWRALEIRRDLDDTCGRLNARWKRGAFRPTAK